MRPGTPKFRGERLREAREARGLSGRSFAELLAVSKQAVSQYERDQQTPSPAVMQRVCEILGIPRAFFVTASSESLNTLFFRSFASATKTERQRQQHRQKWRRRIVAFLRRYIEFPQVSIPQMHAGQPAELTMGDIESLALGMRRHFGLGERPISDVTLLLENHGAVVVRTCFDAKALDAFSEWSLDDDTPYFVLNSEKRSAVRSRLDIVHELGHMVLHRHLPSASHPDRRKLLERQAFRFGAAFLAPKRAFIQSFRGCSLDDLVHLKQVWRLAISALARRALDLELVPESRYRRVMTEIGKRGWRTREPLDDQLLSEHPRLLRRSIDLLLGEKVINPSDLTRIGAGSLRDVEGTIGLPLGYLDEPQLLPFPARVRREASPKERRRRVIRLADHLKA